jgi:hypothetical protein
MPNYSTDIKALTQPTPEEMYGLTTSRPLLPIIEKPAYVAGQNPKALMPPPPVLTIFYEQRQKSAQYKKHSGLKPEQAIYTQIRSKQFTKRQKAAIAEIFGRQ